MVLSIISFGQQHFTDNINYTLTFDESTGLQHLWTDTISNPHNIWQVGKPQKTIFTAPYSLPNAIITDIVNPYPPNNSSVFVIKNVIGGVISNLTLKGKYYANTDSLRDYGRIELSLNRGLTWLDLLKDSELTDTINGQIIHLFLSYYNNEKPILTGNSGGWTNFLIHLGFPGDFYATQGDTVLYRFTFISDNIQNNKDGLMFDDLVFYESVEGINKLGYDPIKSDCFPNPALDQLTISFENNQRSTFELKLFDIKGKLIKLQKVNSNQVILPVQSLQKGMYFYKLADRKNRKFSTGKFIVGVREVY